MSKSFVLAITTVGAVGVAGCVEEVQYNDTASLLRNNGFLPNNQPIPNKLGHTATYSTAGKIDLNNEFFQDLGVNGRRCVSCHLPTAGWSITPEQVQEIFDDTDGGAIDDGFGLGAMFRLNDGANSPLADVSTLEKRRSAYSMLLKRGLIRVGMTVPAEAEFEVVGVSDPYGFAGNNHLNNELSLFRRPLPSTNLKFISAVMWDGREKANRADGSIHFDLSQQSNSAVVGHAEGQPLSDTQRESIVNFEMTLHTAATFDANAKDLTTLNAKGGPQAVAGENFFIGINDNFLVDNPATPENEGFTEVVFNLYDTWKDAPSGDARRAVERGQKLFNTKTAKITGVSGINDEAVFGNPTVVNGTCTTCHNTPNSGNHSTPVPLNIGVDALALNATDHADATFPIYTLKNKTTGATVQVTDPGRALVTGKWKDIGRFKGPVLRGLAARAPYFHNGMAKDLAAVVDFYNDRFDMKMSDREKADMVAFLRTL